MRVNLPTILRRKCPAFHNRSPLTSQLTWPFPSASTSLIMSASSASVGFCPSERMTVPSSRVVIVPSPSISSAQQPDGRVRTNLAAQTRENLVLTLVKQ